MRIYQRMPSIGIYFQATNIPEKPFVESKGLNWYNHIERGTYVSKMIPKIQIEELIKDDLSRQNPILLWDPYVLTCYEGIV